MEDKIMEIKLDNKQRLFMLKLVNIDIKRVESGLFDASMRYRTNLLNIKSKLQKAKDEKVR